MLRRLLEEIQILALAYHQGLTVPAEAWTVSDTILGDVLTLKTLTCQGRGAVPAWKADLSSADLGVALAVIASLHSPLSHRKADLADFLREKCWTPAVADWLSPSTRLHSLDSMGHNWWSVIVGGAGVVAALLGWKPEARQAAEALTSWFRYPGNRSVRKHPNFGPEGDFLEGFGYCDYALIHPFTLAILLPDFPVVPQWLDAAQCRGLAAWYRQAFVRTHDGLWPKRFGDTSNHYKPRPCVWHTLATFARDPHLLTLAHELVSRPVWTLDFLLWHPTAGKPTLHPPPASPRIFPTSGCAFLGPPGLSVSVRAGEFWNHNHLDAGSFIMAQKGSVWIDDAGTCPYGSPRYISHYSSPSAHNVTWAPARVPEIADAKELGLDLRGEFVLTGTVPGLDFIQVDTRLLSGGCLPRSRRNFFVLGEEALVIWDDLESRQPERFETLLHTLQKVRRQAGPHTRLVAPASTTCSVWSFSDTPTRLSVRSAPMGETPVPNRNPLRFRGSVLRWRSTHSVTRQKVLLALGAELVKASWHTLPSGWECRLRTKSGSWLLWFNRLADGRVAHQNTTAIWRGLQTDAYALVLKGDSRKGQRFACNASFVRNKGIVLHSSLRRTALVRLPQPD